MTSVVSKILPLFVYFTELRLVTLVVKCIQGASTTDAKKFSQWGVFSELFLIR